MADYSGSGDVAADFRYQRGDRTRGYLHVIESYQLDRRFPGPGKVPTYEVPDD